MPVTARSRSARIDPRMSRFPDSKQTAPAAVYNTESLTLAGSLKTSSLRYSGMTSPTPRSGGVPQKVCMHAHFQVGCRPACALALHGKLHSMGVSVRLPHRVTNSSLVYAPPPPPPPPPPTQDRHLEKALRGLEYDLGSQTLAGKLKASARSYNTSFHPDYPRYVRGWHHISLYTQRLRLLAHPPCSVCVCVLCCLPSLRVRNVPRFNPNDELGRDKEVAAIMATMDDPVVPQGTLSHAVATSERRYSPMHSSTPRFPDPTTRVPTPTQLGPGAFSPNDALTRRRYDHAGIRCVCVLRKSFRHAACRLAIGMGIPSIGCTALAGV